MISGTNTIRYFLLFALLILAACQQPEKSIYIVCEDDYIRENICEELCNYLSRTYPEQSFEISAIRIEGHKNILLEKETDAGLTNDEAYKILGEEGDLLIRGKTERALFYSIYALLKELGWNFYLSFEIPPDNPSRLDFANINLEDAPLKKKRIIFNWHNFLSGCTGWDYPQWEKWIDNSAKIGFNTIMVHAYGNNPMCSFEFNGQAKDLGYLSTTRKGRDWGTQHVNNVQLLYGGDLFSDDEFGSSAAKTDEDKRNREATNLMHTVFRHAEEKEMEVCFALDVDTWMANPQNVISTLPPDAIINIGGYQTVNPEHLEGRKYYRAQLEQLLADYPQINMLAAWMRRPKQNPGLGSIWLQHNSTTLPEKWKSEYFAILNKHPELKDKQPYPGLFAISKIIQAYREILDEIKPETELFLGSWEFTYVKQADPFIPSYCGFIPLDYDYNLKEEKMIEELEAVGRERLIYPIVWAHHDDHRYIGRPYKPYQDFNTLLDRTNSDGYGIIHWLTHPMDLIFSNYENQVWTNTENETLSQSVKKFTLSLLKKKDTSLIRYYNHWYNEAPMFGRETTDYFLRPDEEYTLDGNESSLEVVVRAKKRLNFLQKVDINALNQNGLKEYNYQVGIEKFIISFFTNHHFIFQANHFLELGQMDSAVMNVQKLNPEESLKLYAKTISSYGATRGELGLMISLNLRWFPDYVDIKQRTRFEDVRINFQPTLHDSLAQYPGNYTFFIDSERKIWLSLGEKELGISTETNGKTPLEDISDSWLTITDIEEIQVQTIRNHTLTKSNYELQLFFDSGSGDCQVEIIQDGVVIHPYERFEAENTKKYCITSNGNAISIRLLPKGDVVKLAGLRIKAIQ